jgi:hypothetical protein
MAWKSRPGVLRRCRLAETTEGRSNALSNELRKQVASIIAGRSPHGGRLDKPLPSREIADLLRREHEEIEQSQVEEVLLELAAVGFIWLSVSSSGRKQTMAVVSVFYPYGLQLIA